MQDGKQSDWSDEMFGVEVSGCVSCNTLMTGTELVCKKCVGKVPVEELESLVEDFRKKGDRYAANELEDTIEKYK